jgi:hypothetical protein
MVENLKQKAEGDSLVLVSIDSDLALGMSNSVEESKYGNFVLFPEFECNLAQICFKNHPFSGMAGEYSQALN